MQEALNDPHFKARGVFKRTLSADGKTIIALPVPVADVFRDAHTRRRLSGAGRRQ